MLQYMLNNEFCADLQTDVMFFSVGRGAGRVASSLRENEERRLIL